MAAKVTLVWVYTFCSIVWYSAEFVSCGIQSFSVPPSDTDVVEGHDVTLPCQVANQKGAVQWSKDGTLLGFDARIPGFPRYSLAGNSSLGVFDLKIENASLDDDADFECQVGPHKGQDSIKAKAHLTVLLAASGVRMVARSNGSSVRVEAGERLSLECEVKGGKPAPDILWRRNAQQMVNDNVQVSIKNEDDGRQIAVSTLSLSPNSDDNNAYYSCEAKSPILSESLTVGVTLDVLYPPGRPTIEGYRSNEKIRAGDSVRLRCVSRGGNPPAKLVWTRDGVTRDHSYATRDSEAENELLLVAEAADDGAEYACAATSVVVVEPMVTSVRLRVLYAPKSITVKAQKEAKVGDVIVATCKTERSNPAADITWIVDGVPVFGENSVESAKEGGGWITSSQINVNVTEQDRNVKLFTCYAVNQELGETVPQSFSVNILYAPDPPRIFGYSEGGGAIHAGRLQRLTCISHGGHPLPDLKWYKGDEEVIGPQQTTSGNILSKELAIIAEASDNGAKYRCKSTSKALAEPLVAEINLTVYFPPTTLKLKVEKPKKPKAGSKVHISCESSPSNPPANITWWRGTKNDLQLTPATVAVSNATSRGGGFVTRATYVMGVAADDDGAVFTCQATNEAVQQSVHDALRLDVYYKPIFPVADPATYEIKENDSSVIDLTARANPDRVTYTWKQKKKKGDAKAIEDGPFFNVTSAVRSQAGEYECRAANDVGESVIKVVVKILYPAVIFKGADSEEGEKVVLAEPESDIQLQCAADGYPLTADTLKWKHALDTGQADETSADGRSVLSVRNVTQSGTFTCVADNGVGSADTWKIIVLVKERPVITSTENNTVSSDRAVSASLYCTAEGIPEVTHTWMHEGGVVSDPRIRNETVKVDHVTYQGILTIDDVTAKDYGDYTCVARNELGFETIRVALIPDGAPDPPLLVRILNTSRDSLLVTWVPGFSGGHNQTHRVRFKGKRDPAFSYLDAHPPGARSLWLRGLRAAEEYEVAMKSVNAKGSSGYTTSIVKAVTLGRYTGATDKGSKKSSLGDSLVDILAGSVGTVFFLLLVFNIVLLALYYHKKDRRRRKYSADTISRSSDTSSKPGSDETTFSSYTEYSVDEKGAKTELTESGISAADDNSEESSCWQSWNKLCTY